MAQGRCRLFSNECRSVGGVLTYRSKLAVCRTPAEMNDNTICWSSRGKPWNRKRPVGFDGLDEENEGEGDPRKTTRATLNVLIAPRRASLFNLLFLFNANHRMSEHWPFNPSLSSSSHSSPDKPSISNSWMKKLSFKMIRMRSLR